MEIEEKFMKWNERALKYTHNDEIKCCPLCIAKVAYFEGYRQYELKNLTLRKRRDQVEVTK